jgi:hypothetical protein
VHHEILCAVIQAEGTDQQALTAATLHNVPLHIVFSRGLNGNMPQKKLNLLQFSARAVFPLNTTVQDLVFKIPIAWNWNAAFQRALPWAMNLRFLT